MLFERPLISDLDPGFLESTDNFVRLAKGSKESTEITSDPTATGSSTLVLPGIVNIPSIKSLSLKPTNNEIL